jgi:hypothetical protein
MIIMSRLTITLGALALLSAGFQPKIETAALLPRPQVVVVQNFAVWPGEVQFDSGPERHDRRGAGQQPRPLGRHAAPSGRLVDDQGDLR